MEKIAGIHAVNTVSTRRVTEKMAVVCMAVNMGRNVMEVYFFLNLGMLSAYSLFN